MKKFIKQLIPPIVTNLFSKKKLNNFTYEGIFKHFSEVKYSKKYDEKILGDHIFNLTNYNLEDYKLSNSFPSTNFRSSVSNLYSLFLSSYESSQKDQTRVLDYGGAMGLSFIEASSNFDTSKLDYKILDFSEITEKGASLTKDFSNVKYINSLRQISETDVVHFGSSMQYLDDYTKVIEKINLLNPKIIFITNTFFSTQSTFVTSQNNLYGLKIPCWIFELSEIENILDRLDFYLIHKSSNIDSGNLVTPDYFPELRSLNLLFKRR